jgi:tight adherence protein B
MLAICCLVGASGAVAWPVPGGRPRLRAIDRRWTRRSQTGRTGSVGAGRAESVDNGLIWPVACLLRMSGRIHGTDWFRGLMGGGRPRWRTVSVVAVAAGVAGLALGGPVAAFAAAVYSTLAVRSWLRRRSASKLERLRRTKIDDLCALAADLRAGLPVPTDLLAGAPIPAGQLAPAVPRDGSLAWLGEEAEPDARSGPGRIEGLVRAAAHLAEQTGAPLAELVERIEADARATERGVAAALAQAAGARATAWLLAGLPVGGIALGYGIGVDPLAVLLYHPVGGMCAMTAIVLQLAGLAWAERLTSGPTRSA